MWRRAEVSNPKRVLVAPTDFKSALLPEKVTRQISEAIASLERT